MANFHHYLYWTIWPPCYLDDVHLGVLQELGEHGDSVVLEHGVGLRVVAGDHVAEGAQARRHHLELPAVQQPHQVGDHLGVHDTLQEDKMWNTDIDRLRVLFKYLDYRVK